jgi:hypothetical protein
MNIASCATVLLGVASKRRLPSPIRRVTAILGPGGDACAQPRTGPPGGPTSGHLSPVRGGGLPSGMTEPPAGLASGGRAPLERRL